MKKIIHILFFLPFLGKAQAVFDCMEIKQYPKAETCTCEMKSVIVGCTIDSIVVSNTNYYVSDTLINGAICKVEHLPKQTKMAVAIPIYQNVQVCNKTIRGAVVKWVNKDCD
jgi:hypothetical protein